MNIKNLFIRTYYAIIFRKRSGSLLFEHDGVSDFELYNTDWKSWYADPFVYKYDGKEWLFAEKMNMITHKGCIVVAQIKKDGIGRFEEILNENFHLSYPMVFTKDSNIYMIPESAKEKSIYLYKCLRFPDQWKKERTLLKGAYYADTNVLFYQNHFYLITGEMDPSIGAKTKLHIYNADMIEKGQLEQLYTDDKFDYCFDSRGAGNILILGDRVIRPTQLGDMRHYGKQINFYSVSLNDRYRQTLVNSFGCNRISLNKDLKFTGTHTYALSDEFEIVDIQYSRLTHPVIMIKTVINKIRKYM